MSQEIRKRKLHATYHFDSHHGKVHTDVYQLNDVVLGEIDTNGIDSVVLGIKNGSMLHMVRLPKDTEEHASYHWQNSVNADGEQFDYGIFHLDPKAAGELYNNVLASYNNLKNGIPVLEERTQQMVKDLYSSHSHMYRKGHGKVHID